MRENQLGLARERLPMIAANCQRISTGFVESAVNEIVSNE
jgi:hypothetical protein